MNEDNRVFWHNNEQASALFYDLLARSEQDAYDDNFLMQLAAYREAAPTSERADIFAAKYLLHHGDAENAAVCAERAYRKRPVNREIWLLLAESYARLDRPVDALTMYGYAYGLYLSPEIPMELLMRGGKDGLDRLSIAAGIGTGAPMTQNRAFLAGADHALEFQLDAFVGEYLPLTPPEGSARYWVAAYVDNAFLSDQSQLIEKMRHTDVFVDRMQRDYPFCLQRAQEVRGRVTIEVPEGAEVILPIAGTEPLQELTIASKSQPPASAYLGKWAFSQFRLTETTEITPASDAVYAVGTPIRLGHSPARRKLVLNILIDGLAWNIARTHFPDAMPNIAHFFARGTIFDQHFSTSECTYPSLPVIETGRYPTHTQVFNERNSHELPLDMMTLSECMTDLGYYAAAPMGAADPIYSGTLRGYDQLNTTGWKLLSAEAVDRTIMQLEAFDETDQFLHLHVADVHPWNAKGFKFHPAVETHLPLSERLFDTDEHIASVRLPKLKIYQEQFWQSLRRADRNLAQLLTYIEEHYAEEEYLVSVYSDHGNSIFSAPVNGVMDVIAENSTRALWMMRGAGVPEGRIVNELTSSADLYPTLGALCGFPAADDIDGNLPAVFGGKERDAVYSMSMFPGQTYKLAVRTHDFALRLETQEKVDEDGTVNFADARVGIYPRTHELEEDCAVDSAELRAFFYPRARSIARAIANNGEFWPAMREARPEWFGSSTKEHL
ncbi:sulfatase-like hydrolase/transferase [Selenomonas sp. oral taxon 478]|uniref:sulfatase-like hydrolase/transferase n=1 Tax=Selenomonas sp. oral taxon 478 TaxID=712538 RepID=UPI00067A3094|nr:sulfatase-like hydrolase/transferase [Selenomonas sp. oral taxon 478]AKT53799.1 choline sulfatase [Selenomonas sp. oral taxon 478]